MRDNHFLWISPSMKWSLYPYPIASFITIMYENFVYEVSEYEQLFNELD